MSDGRRVSSLSPPEFYLLSEWGHTLYLAFDRQPYLVGSVARNEAWRDVDVRLLLDPDDAILSDKQRVLALNVGMSMWGQRATGLPIDFQFQATERPHVALPEFQDQPRVPLGFRTRHLIREGNPDE